MSVAERVHTESAEVKVRLEEFIQARTTFSINRIIEIHQRWYESLRNYVASDKPAPMDPSSTRSTHHCVLGHWIDEEGEIIFHGYQTFDHLKQSHEAYHRVAAEVVALKQAQKHEDALILLEGAFQDISRQVIHHLRGLRSLV